jgi:type II secretory pathway component PulK
MTKINENTAPGDVLTALFPTLNPDTLEQFLASRLETPVRGVSELRERLGFPPRVQIDGLNLTSPRSEFFSIVALATVGTISQALRVIVQRRATEVIPLYWQPATPVAVSNVKM